MAKVELDPGSKIAEPADKLLRSPLEDIDCVNTSDSGVVTHQSPQSANTPSTCSMGTCTQGTDFIDGFGSDDQEEEVSWGRLFPVGSSFNAFDLVKEEYSFGRGDNCDYAFNTALMKKHPCFLSYSKIHFKIAREETSTGLHVFLTDMSSNGTFINGEKVGKNCKQVLSNNDEISLSLKRNKAFVFMDPNATDDKDLPQQLRDKYTLSKVLGRGACGEVKLAFEKGSCNKYAVKIIQKKKFSVGGKNQMNTANQVLNEVNILKSLKHPCIIAIEDVIDLPDTLYIVLELVEGGELFDRVISIEKFDEPTAKLLFYQMACGIKYLHDMDITHRDLKPENILLSADENETLIKITDFGLSKFVDGNTMLKTFCGTPNYLAPEILLSKGVGEYTKSIDCWSLGVILFICLVGYPPFSEDRKDMDLPKQITGGHFTMPDDYWSDISDEAKDLIRKLLTTNPKKRITIADTLNHTWLKDEEMITKAKKLMFPESSGMNPPMGLPVKRKIENDAPSKSNKKKST